MPTANSGVAQTDLGLPDTITPNGLRLVRAETVPAMQECFLRALAVYYIPSIVEKKGYDFAVFSPLRHTLRVMRALEKASGDSRLNFIEMALIVQITSNDDDLKTIVASVLKFREQRNKSVNKKRFDREQRNTAAKTHGYAAHTFDDYADTNFRYLKATGLVQSNGRGLSLGAERKVFVNQLLAMDAAPVSAHEYFAVLCNGAALPTDDAPTARLVLDDLLKQIKTRGIPFSTKAFALDSAADIAIVRHEIESLLARQNEAHFANAQPGAWEEIAAYMELIIKRKSGKTLANGFAIEIPRTEMPAYFEWVMWRAFLAINSLYNKPHEARRFKIDQDFLPVGTAPGGGADVVLEFSEFVLAVEATLTENSRQKAAEGESVRRHIADLALTHKNKSVCGWFIANKIDSNTAETVRIGVWYRKNDERMRLDIVQFTLTQFKAFFEAMFKSKQNKVALLRTLLDSCGASRPQLDALAWKTEIARVVDSHARQLSDE